MYAPTGIQSGVGSLTIGGDFTATPSSVSLSGTPDASTGTLSPTTVSFGNQVVGTTSASQTVTLSLNSNSSAAVSPISLAGTGVAPAAVLSPASLSFASQLVNTSSAAQAVTLSNLGTATLTINSIGVTGDFSQTNNCGASLAAGASCIINVIFTPRSLGAASATLSITSDAPGSPTNVALSGNGVNAAPTLSPTSLSFGNVFVGKTSGGKTVTLTSNGPAALTISSISVSAGFSQTNNCPASLNPGTSCSINVSFKPLAGGVAAGALSIADNGYGSPQTVALSGNGLDFSVSASPASATVTAGQKASYTVTVSPLGGAYNSNVALSCSTLPSGAKCSFSPSGVSPGSSSINSALTVSTSSGSTVTPPGTYSLTINGTANGTTHSTTIELVVN